MFQPLNSVFNRPPRQWDSSDVKYFVQSYLRDRLRTEEVYCDQVRGKTALVRAATPAMRQQVLLLEFDVVRELGKHTDFKLDAVALTTQRA